MSSPRLSAAFLSLTLLATVSAMARAEVVQRGDLRVSVSGRLDPRSLPRTVAAPISIEVGGKIATVDGSPPPKLTTFRVELNRHGRLDTRGLPECRVGQIHPASTARALEACRPALVGRGRISIEVVLGGTEPYSSSGQLLVFNASYNGRPNLLGQIYVAHPFATSFVVPFVIDKRPHGRYGTTLSASLPPALTSWGHVTGLEMRLSRRYTYKGARRSVINAACPAPDGFSRAEFTLARTTFGFAANGRVSATLTRTCQVVP